MPDYLILVDDLKHWKSHYPNLPIASVRDYLTGGHYQKKQQLNVINLCRNINHHSLGYYASLLAEARGHHALPSVRTLQDLTRKTLYGPVIEELDEAIEKVFSKQAQSLDIASFEIVTHFGYCESEILQPLARKLFEAFPVPLLKIECRRNGRWRIHRLRMGHLISLSHAQQNYFFQILDKQLQRRWRTPQDAKVMRYSLAILHNPKETLAPSDTKALQYFIRAAADCGIDAELIQPKDFGHLAEYDALFIRETTSLNHHTYRFARKAASEGMVVIDDPNSILRCVDKIFLTELLTANHIPIPASVILAKGELERAEQQLAYPMVLKIPDGAFSRGMYKVQDREELEKGAEALFAQSDLILAQAYTYTDFDWRVGILNGKALYVCRYYMSRGHWQIINHNEGKIRQGKWDTLAVTDAPEEVVNTALRAAKLIGQGLYGVDLKSTDKGVVVIEINDNPSIETQVEDKVIGKQLYALIMQEFLRRLEARYRKT